MQISADRIWDGLRFVVIEHASEIAPAGVAAHLDQAGADHDAKSEPAEKPDDQDRRATFWKWPRVDKRTKKNRQETGLEELDFPAVAVPNLANVDDRHVHRPEDRKQDRVRVTAEHDERESKSRPSKDRQSVVGNPKPEQRRDIEHSGGARTRFVFDSCEIMCSRGETVRTDQRHQLIGRNQERDRVNEPEQSENDKAR